MKAKTVMYWVAIFMIVMVCLGLGIGSWVLARNIKYKLGYHAQVANTVCEMVKPEYLRNPNECK